MLEYRTLHCSTGTAQHSLPYHSTAQHSTAQHSTAQHSTAQHSTAQHSTAQHSTAQHSTAQHSTAQLSTAQHSTAQYNLLQYPAKINEERMKKGKRLGYVICNAVAIHNRHFNPILHGGGAKYAPLLFFLHHPYTAQGIKLKFSDFKDTPLRHFLQVKPVRYIFSCCHGNKF